MTFANVVIRMAMMFLLIGAAASTGNWIFGALAFVNAVLFIFWSVRELEEAER